jgi:hypothetical protein
MSGVANAVFTFPGGTTRTYHVARAVMVQYQENAPSHISMYFETGGLLVSITPPTAPPVGTVPLLDQGREGPRREPRVRGVCRFASAGTSADSQRARDFFACSTS